MSHVRADQLLVERGLAPTRSAAQRLIKAGAVLSDGKPIGKAGELLEFDADLLLTDTAELRYVSRAGLKLEGALRASGANPAGMTCLDVGISTGGFTDCLLQLGAAHVVGIEVGHDQLSPRLQSDARVTNCEGINARYLTREQLPQSVRDFEFQLAVVDVSFISLKLVLPAVLPLLAPKAFVFALVKPQFELGKGALGRDGKPSDPNAYTTLKDGMLEFAQAQQLNVSLWLDSPITGQDGNREFFLIASK